MSIASFYKSQTILLTGATGFIGKVLLARFLEVAEPKKIYVLLRWKVNPPHQRLQETLASDCFNHVRDMKNMSHDEFLAWARTKISIFEGDLQKTKLGLSSGDLSKLKNEVTMIIHNAANVKFEEKLHESVQVNIFGCLELLDLAKSCTKLVSYLHVSTAYVNSNLLHADSSGNIPIDEKLYPLDFDAEELYERLLAATNITKAQEKQIIGNHPNVYTFTKSLSEHLIIQRRESIPIAIVRPGMVGVSYRNPMPGWYDNVSAVGGLVLLSALGVVRYFPDMEDNIIDQIPVDYVVDTYLATGMYRAREPVGPENEPIIVHSTSSCRNPCSMRLAMTTSVDYFKKLDMPIPNKLRKPGISEIKAGLHARVLLDTFPWKFTYRISKLIPSRRVRKIGKLFSNAADHALMVATTFKYFMVNSWVHDTSNLLRVKASLCPADQKTFSLDPSDISWTFFSTLFSYGIHRYILKEEGELPELESEDPMDGIAGQMKIGVEPLNTLPFRQPQMSAQSLRTPRLWSKL